MARCAFCLREVDAKEAWKGSQGHFFCSEFCADMEPTYLFPPEVSSAEPPDPQPRR
jgi:hypothetical protein